MASQTPAKCQFCEASAEINFKCINCDLFLCDHCCQRIHSKSKSSQSHQIINLKDYGSEDVAASHRQVDLDHMTCAVHENQKCLSFCSQCDITVCFLCFREAHSDHKLLDIQEVYDNQVSKIKQLRLKINTDLPFFQAEKHKLQKTLGDLQKEKDEVTKKIKDREQMLKYLLSKHVQDLLNKRDQIYNESEVKIKHELSNVQISQDILTESKEQLDKALESFKAADVLIKNQILETKLPEKTERNIQFPKADFIPGNVTNVDLLAWFGEVYEISDLQLIQTFRTNFKNIGSILNCVHKESFFIGSNTNKKLQEVKFEEDKMVVVKEQNIKVLDMTAMGNGDILISSGDTKLKLYTHDGRLETFKDFSPLRTTGVHASQYNEIILGLVEPGYIKVKSNSIRKVVVLNQRAEIIHTYEYDRKNQRLFSMPGRITSMNDNIYVIDLLKIIEKRRVVVLGYGGQVKWVYNGDNKRELSVNKFSPGDITVTTSGLVLVSDHLDKIHILNQIGELIICHHVQDLGVKSPFSLIVDSSGYLWVGCTTRKRYGPQRAKLHKLKLF